MTNKPPVNGNNPSKPGSRKLKFLGLLPMIKQLTWEAGIRGNWTAQPHGVWLFRLRNGAVMSWSSTKGTVWFAGPQAAQEELARAIETALHRWIYPGTNGGKSAVDRPRRGGAPRARRRQRQ